MKKKELAGKLQDLHDKGFDINPEPWTNEGLWEMMNLIIGLKRELCGEIKRKKK